METALASNSERTTYFCLPSAVIKSLHHYAQAKRPAPPYLANSFFHLTDEDCQASGSSFLRNPRGFLKLSAQSHRSNELQGWDSDPGHQPPKASLLVKQLHCFVYTSPYSLCLSSSQYCSYMLTLESGILKSCWLVTGLLPDTPQENSMPISAEPITINVKATNDSSR